MNMPVNRKLIRLAITMTISLWLFQPSFAVRYDQGDWVGFTMFKYITSIAADQSIVYFGTTGGIIRYDRFTQTWLDPLTTAGGMPSNYVRELAYDFQYNELWAVTDQGVAKYNITFESWYSESDFPENMVINDWHKSRFASLFTPFRYNYSDGYISDPNMRQFPITVGYQGEHDLMYVGTWGMGPGIIDTRHLQFESIVYGPYNFNISKVIEIGDRLWMGTDYTQGEQGITSYDLGTHQWSYFEEEYIIGLDNAEITAGVNSGDYIWLGTRDGLLRMDNSGSFNTLRTTRGLPSTTILSLAEYGGLLYVGTDDGLAILHSSGDVPDSTFKMPLEDQYLLRNFRVNDLLAFKGTLYIATDDGVFSYNSDKAQFRKLDTPAADLSWGATDIAADDRIVYFGARFGVVTIDTEVDTFSVATDHHLSDGWTINQVYADHQYIWAATNIGLWKYRMSDGYTYLYTTADGLPTDVVNSLVIDSDYFWLGTNQGLIHFLWNKPGRGD